MARNRGQSGGGSKWSTTCTDGSHSSKNCPSNTSQSPSNHARRRCSGSASNTRTYCWSLSTSARLSNTRDGTNALVSPVSGSVYVGPGRIGCQYTPYIGSYRGGPSGSGGQVSTNLRLTHACPIPPGLALARRRGRIPGTVLDR